MPSPLGFPSCTLFSIFLISLWNTDTWFALDELSLQPLFSWVITFLIRACTECCLNLPQTFDVDMLLLQGLYLFLWTWQTLHGINSRSFEPSGIVCMMISKIQIMLFTWKEWDHLDSIKWKCVLEKYVLPHSSIIIVLAINTRGLSKVLHFCASQCVPK